MKLEEAITFLKANDPANTTLDLSLNQIGPEGAKHLAEALQVNNTVTTLNLWNNDIEDEGAKHFAGALQANDAVTTLNLGKNPFGAEGAKYLMEAVQMNKTISILQVECNLKHLADLLRPSDLAAGASNLWLRCRGDECGSLLRQSTNCE